MSPRWLILADDLTGAADAGVAFARRGRGTEVTWELRPDVTDVEVQAVDLDTRARAAHEAAARHRHAVLNGLGTGQLLFKKMDSTLRGQPAAEIAAICAALRERGRSDWGLLAPANPSMRRITRDGRVFVAGAPLEDDETWKREHSYPDADLAAVMHSAGLQAIKLPLAKVRGGAQDLRRAIAAAGSAKSAAGTVLICDAETNDDLARIAAATGDSAMPGFFIGTAGLANALAAAGGEAGRTVAFAPAPRGTLVAVGTLARVSRQAAVRLAEKTGANLVRIAAAAPDAARDAGDRLKRGETVVALLDAPETAGGAPDAAQARAFAAALDFALRQMGALIVTGGETAAALLARCKVRGIRLLDELEPGVALGVTRGEMEVPIVTKPGAFGDEDSLVRCLHRLNQLRPDS